jgi:hypothetical protein
MEATGGPVGNEYKSSAEGIASHANSHYPILFVHKLVYPGLIPKGHSPFDRRIDQDLVKTAAFQHSRPSFSGGAKRLASIRHDHPRVGDGIGFFFNPRP